MVRPAEREADDPSQRGAHGEDDGYEGDREQELAPVLGINADPVDPEKRHVRSFSMRLSASIGP